MKLFGRFSLMSALLAAFAAAAPAQARRAAGGHPDFTGNWNVATLTPLERPKEFAGRATVSDSEAAAWEKKDHTQSPDEGDSLAETELLRAQRAVGARDSDGWEFASEMARVRRVKRTSLIVAPADGHLPARTAAGKARLARLFENTNSAREVVQRPPGERCLPDSEVPIFPYGMFDLYRITQTPAAIVIQSELDVRIVRMNATHPPAGVRSWTGDSVGRWEQDTLVIDTTNFNDQLNSGGTDRNLHVVERISRMDSGALLYRATVEDPTVYAGQWTVEFPWVATSQPLFEYACHEGNYSLPAILEAGRQRGDKPDQK